MYQSYSLITITNTDLDRKYLNSVKKISYIFGCSSAPDKKGYQ